MKKDNTKENIKTIGEVLKKDTSVGADEEIRVCQYCGKPKIKKQYANFSIWVEDCTCVADREQAEETRRRNYEKFKALRKQYKQAGFTRRQLGHRLRNLTCEHKDKFAEWVKEFKPRKSKGMFLYGGVGNGKTTSGSSIAKELVNMGYKKVYFYTMAEYLNKMQQTYTAGSKISFDDLLQKWFDADAIFIDDFGREKYSDKRLENVFLFFDGLYNNCTTFFIMANPENILRVKSIPEFEAIFDRFSETLEKVVFKAESMRKRKEEN